MKEGLYDWTDDSIRVENRLVFQQGETVRLLVLDPKVSMSLSHYVAARDGRGSVYRCLQQDGKECPRCKAGDQAKPRFGAVVLVYRNLDQKVWEIMPWLFGGDKFTRLRGIAKGGAVLLKTDLQVTCFNEKFQNVKIEPIEGPPMWQMWDIKNEMIAAYKSCGINVLRMISADREGFETSPAKAEKRRAPGGAPSTPPRSVPKKDSEATAVLTDEELALFGDAGSIDAIDAPDLSETLDEPVETPPTAEPVPAPKAKPSRKAVDESMDSELDRLIGDL